VNLRQVIDERTDRLVEAVADAVEQFERGDGERPSGGVECGQCPLDGQRDAVDGGDDGGRARVAERRPRQQPVEVGVERLVNVEQRIAPPALQHVELPRHPGEHGTEESMVDLRLDVEVADVEAPPQRGQLVASLACSPYGLWREVRQPAGRPGQAGDVVAQRWLLACPPFPDVRRQAGELVGGDLCRGHGTSSLVVRVTGWATSSAATQQAA
jgi:hypothetical protein